jgi:hypothetical protein
MTCEDVLAHIAGRALITEAVEALEAEHAA